MVDGGGTGDDRFEGPRWTTGSLSEAVRRVRHEDDTEENEDAPALVQCEVLLHKMLQLATALQAIARWTAFAFLIVLLHALVVWATKQ